MNGTTSHNGHAVGSGKIQNELLQLNLEMKNLKYENKYAKYHGDKLIGVSPLLPSRPYSVTDHVTGQGRP